MCFVEEHHIAFQLSELGNAADMAQSGLELAKNISTHASWLADLAHASRKCWLQAATFCSTPASWPSSKMRTWNPFAENLNLWHLCWKPLFGVPGACGQSPCAGPAPPAPVRNSRTRHTPAVHSFRSAQTFFCETAMIQLDYSLQVANCFVRTAL